MSSEFDINEVLGRFHERLGETGLKSTRQRDVIVEIFFRLNKHISVEELLEEARRQSPRIGYATVYRTLRLLVEQGFAEPRQFGDGQTRYDPTYGEEVEHDHLVCVDCRRVLEFRDDEVNGRIAAIVSRLGTFSVTHQRLELYARCTNASCPHRPPSSGIEEGDA